MKVAIIGATGSLGRTVADYLLEHSDDEMTLMARSASSLRLRDAERQTALDIDATDESALSTALSGSRIDAVFVAVSGALTEIAETVVTAMKAAGARRLIFISSMGIYDEIPASVGAEGNLSRNPMLRSYREAADVVEESGLDYTVIRPGWFDNGSDDTGYQITRKGEPFGGHDVSRAAIANLVSRLLHTPSFGTHESLGINRPNS
ncbi:MAG: NAD(P)H-binding protein [Bifidobacteriaceae bacterium]|jgi:uncharacterized protein YbjT (DUF2867 family)|nr:NAD(P)H-binding protein [Bifidobacteriaceae bacterium]